MENTYSFRQATLADADAIFQLGREEGAFPFWTEEEVLRSFASGVVVVAEEGEDLIAFRYGEHHCGDIFLGLGFMVKHTHRSKGVGAGLSFFMFEVLKKAGYSLAITSNSDVYLDHYKKPQVGGAAAFYEKLGYELVAKTPTTYLFIKHL